MLLSTMPAVLFRLICVRHGETVANKEGRIQGHIDIPLNDLGQEQAKRAGIALESWNFSRAYSSDLSRARQTAENILAKSKMESPPGLQQDQRIRERAFGEFDNLLIGEVNALLRSRNTSWPQYTPEGGETMGQVDERFFSFFKSLCQSVYDKHNNNSSAANGNQSSDGSKEDLCGTPLSSEEISEERIAETILLVSHGAALRQFYSILQSQLKCAFPVDINTFPRNTAYSVFTVRYSPKKYSLMCHDYNNASHIDDI